MKTLLTACGLVAALATAPAFAQSTPKPVTNNAPAVASTEGAIDPALARMKAEDLKGKNIYGSDGKDMAEIEGIVRKNNQTYAVIDVDHVADMSDKDVVLPLNKLHMKGDKLTLDMTKDQLQGLEKWQKGQYQDMKGALK